MHEPRTRMASRSGRAALVRLAIVVAVLAVAAGGVWLVARAASPQAGPTTTDIPALDVRPADVEPGSVAPATDHITDRNSGRAGGGQASAPGANPLLDWARTTSAATAVPQRALLAYGNAELVMREHQPSCRLSWATLAGIGRVESNHGRYGGATLGENGRPSKPIIGIPLDGSEGVKAILDTDGGRLDGDVRHDRAVGPMQFIPSTWLRHGTDASGDGLADPQQIDDAALSAARYLCSGGRDMSTADGWWSGVMSYNNSTEYARKVFGLAEDYATAVRQAR
ncbi:membrane-bound lytic murein transglycosylase B [Saccharomonospora marina XMU15]|uniref:Membrane-bound lytic murein transglycosylase B n=2 Tax=Saccharomonospora TaxID=1851 RepID=H5XBF8_9PSEU|nr:membrane-bound lytic murein transglycosylase B [Saccharomonospora marina XMU15]